MLQTRFPSQAIASALRDFDHERMFKKYSGIFSPIFSHAVANSHSAGGLDGSERSFLILSSSKTPVYRIYSMGGAFGIVSNASASAVVELVTFSKGLLSGDK